MECEKLPLILNFHTKHSWEVLSYDSSYIVRCNENRKYDDKTRLEINQSEFDSIWESLLLLILDEIYQCKKNDFVEFLCQTEPNTSFTFEVVFWRRFYDPYINDMSDKIANILNYLFPNYRIENCQDSIKILSKN